MTPRKPYKFSLQDIADAKGASVGAVRKAKQRGKFDPSNLLSVVRYIMSGNWNP